MLPDVGIEDRLTGGSPRSLGRAEEVVADVLAETDPALQRMREGQAEQRLTGLRDFAALLAERGGLRPGLSVDRGADIIWTVCAQSNYDSLVTARCWSHDEYRDWLADTLFQTLLAPDR